MLLNEIYDLVVERISTSAVGDEAFKELAVNLPKLMNSWYKHNAQQLPFYAYKKDPEARIDSTKGIALVTNKIGRWVDEILTVVANRHVGGKDLGTELGKRDAYVTFDKLDQGTNGAYYPSWHAIKIDTQFIKPFAEKAYNVMYSSFADNNYEVYPPFDESDYEFTDYYRNICKVFVHELIHAQQNERTPGAKWNYSSYVIKNAKKFHQSISKELGNWDDQAYLGSPQEIEAHAQDFVYDQLKWNIGEEPENQLIYVQDIMKGLNDDFKFSRYRNMNGDRPGVQKAKQRYLKKVYQELDARKEAIEKQISQRKNRQEVPDDADYVQ